MHAEHGGVVEVQARPAVRERAGRAPELFPVAQEERVDVEVDAPEAVAEHKAHKVRQHDRGLVVRVGGLGASGGRACVEGRGVVKRVGRGVDVVVRSISDSLVTRRLGLEDHVLVAPPLVLQLGRGIKLLDGIPHFEVDRLLEPRMQEHRGPGIRFQFIKHPPLPGRAMVLGPLGLRNPEPKLGPAGRRSVFEREMQAEVLCVEERKKRHVGLVGKLASPKHVEDAAVGTVAWGVRKIMCSGGGERRENKM